MTNPLNPHDIVPNNQKLWEMLYEAAPRAGLPLPSQKSYRPNQGDLKWEPFDGIYLPDDDSFWCGVFHPKDKYNEDYRYHIIFCPEGKNILNHQFDVTGARWLTKSNYLVEKPRPGVMYVPDNPRNHPEYAHNVTVKSSLNKPLFTNLAFFSLQSWDKQCEWLSLFMWNAWTDVRKF